MSFYLIGFNINQVKKEGGNITSTSKEKLTDELLEVMASTNNTGLSRQSSDSMGTENFVLAFFNDRHEKASPSEIAQRFNITVARVSTVFKHLEAKHLVTRQINPEDKRKFIFKLTDIGKQHVAEQDQIRYENFAQLVDYLGEEDTQTYIRILRKLASRKSERK